MLDSVFKKYDIRGVVGTELQLDQVTRLGRAIAFYFRKQMPHLQRVAVGWDGRTHSPSMQKSLIKGLRESGLDVVSLGLCATPVMYFATYTQPVDAGLMITASHNGAAYNGIKISLNKQTVWGDQVQEIKKHFQANDAIKCESEGKLEHCDIIPKYVAWMRKEFSELVGCQVQMMVDCGNGAAGSVMPQLLEAMEWSNVELLYEEVDGTYPNHEADPTVIANMKELRERLIATESIFGIGFDGDCDRMAAMTEQGHLVLGDELLALFSRDVLKNNSGATIVCDIKCSQGLQSVVTDAGGVLQFAPCGHSLIKNAMKKSGAVLGGELSCHFYFNDRFWGYDDGFYAMMRLVEQVMYNKSSLRDLLAFFPRSVTTPEFRLTYEGRDLPALVSKAGTKLKEKFGGAVTTVDGVRLDKAGAWGLVRASNTQPVLSLRFEAPTHAELEHIKHLFEQTLVIALGEGWLGTL
jgi:phosphomannomutase / phosphoglucomutase